MIMQTIKEFVLEKKMRSNHLVVFFHAYTSSPEKLEHVISTCRSWEGMKDADILIPRMPAGIFSLADPVRLTYEVLTKLDELWENNAGQYAKITLIGHSLGALLARKLYLYACGENVEAPFEIENLKQKEWAGNVDRIILLAGMNRGWDISYHMSLFNTVMFTLGSFIGNLIVLTSSQTPLIFTIRRGSSFITQLRLQWLAMRNKETVKAKQAGNALTVQLLGTVDDLVSPDDNLDLVTGRDFIYVDVPRSGHANVIEMDAR